MFNLILEFSLQDIMIDPSTKKFHHSLTSLIQKQHESLLMPFHKMKKVPSHMQSSDESCVISIYELKFTHFITQLKIHFAKLKFCLFFGKRQQSIHMCLYVNSHKQCLSNIPSWCAPLSWHFQLQFSLDACTNEFFDAIFCCTMKVHNWLFLTILLFQNMDCNGFTISIPYSSGLTQITANFIIRSFGYAVLLATSEKRKVANNRRYVRPKYHVDHKK